MSFYTCYLYNPLIYLWKHKPQENKKKDYISRNMASNNSSENN